MTSIEKRGAPYETRAVMDAPIVTGTDSVKVARGYAALFNSRADIGGMFYETIASGAFDGQLSADVRALIDHDAGRVIGRTKAGTLRLSVDTNGLAVEIDLPDTTDGRDLAVQLERGDISGMSFGFRVLKDEWDDSGDIPSRTIRAVELFEVSAVAFPAYDNTSIGLRSLETARAEAEAVKAAEERKKENDMAAKRRIAVRRAKMEQQIRGIRQDAA
ncbi:MAG: HK97 family phage prohead protease [Mesorhizobium sp.]